MADRFNPITDLQPVDPFNVPVEESSEEIESIRVKLIVTRNKTAELVNIIKKKNISFKKDVDTIRELNRRLMKTIPRIPILRGESSTQTNRLREISGQKGEFDMDVTTSTTTKEPSANIAGRILNFVIDIVTIYFGGKIIKGILKKLGLNWLLKNKIFQQKIKNLEKIFNNPSYIKPNQPIRVKPSKVIELPLSREQIKLNNIRNTLKEAENKIGLFDKKVKVNRESFFNLKKDRTIKSSEFTGPQDLFKNFRKIIEKVTEKTEEATGGVLDFITKPGRKIKKKIIKDNMDEFLNPQNNPFDVVGGKNKNLQSLNTDTTTINNFFITDEGTFT